LFYLSLVASVPLIQLFGHIHGGHTVLVARLQCSLFICKDLKLKGFEIKRIRKDLKIENSDKD
jgi:hypothetical protein